MSRRHAHPISLFVAAVLVAVLPLAVGPAGLLSPARGNQPKKAEPKKAEPEKEPEEVDPAVLAKQLGSLPRRAFYRHASYVFDHVTRYAQADQSRISPQDQFLRAYYEGRWEEIRATLARLPEPLCANIYNKMLTDLTGRYVPVLTLDDFLGLADACPGAMTVEQVRKLGLVLRVAVSADQELWLKRALAKGSRRLGKDAKRRLVTGRILLHADFDELARQHLPTLDEAGRLEDLEVREEVVRFLASQEDLEQFQQTQFADLWREHASAIGDPGSDASKQQKAIDALADVLGRAPSRVVRPWLLDLAGKDPVAVLRLATSFGKRSQTKINDPNIELRINNLEAQKCLVECVGKSADLSKPPWNQVALMLADWWIREAENTFVDRPAHRAAAANRKSRYTHVAPADLLESSPDGAWAAALSGSRRERVDVCRSQAVLVSDRYEEAAELIVELAGRNLEAGITLAEEYVKEWARRHDPHVPEAIRKKHGLAGDARIMVTPLMMEKNVDSLATMMGMFRERGIRARNAELVVDAFDVCYDKAQVYRRSHLDAVFGPVGDMDEGMFFHMIRKMTDGLASRWRSMEVQEGSGTRRDEAETLEMVRRGYRSAVEMIDERVARHADAWKVIALGGSLLSDWGDFEYYQELVASDGKTRIEAFQEKNRLSGTYFARAADAYAKAVPKLGRQEYSVDVFLAWFHSLFGINSGGNLNLSKPLDRAALGKIHERIRALGEGAAGPHIDLFAKHVNSRMEDTANPIHAELKHKYLAGSLVIIKDSPFSFQAQEKVTYFDELLDEIRLETRVDGPSLVNRDHEFGILLSVQHTEAMGRMADFGRYLTNQKPSGRSPQQGTVHGMSAAQGWRDELELNINEALSLFFDVLSITFSPNDVRPRAAEKPGWEETVLAYVRVKVKDASVDKIPPVQMNLEFLDMTGPVTIAAESAETMIKVTDRPVPPRPFRRLEVTQTLDTRNLATSGEILIEVGATASGLVPELEEVLDLGVLDKRCPLLRVDEQGGTLVKQLNSWGDEVHAVSERQWTVVLDGSESAESGRGVELELPRAKPSDAAVAYRGYVDMDLVELDGPVVAVGSSGGEPAGAAMVEAGPIDTRWIVAGAVAGVFVLGIAMVGVVWLVRGPKHRPVRASDVFKMPEAIDGFVVVRLLRALGASDLVDLPDDERAQMREEIRRIERSCFRGGAAGMSEEELSEVTRKWLEIAC